MFIERLILSNFRCFGSESRVIELSSGLTAFVGANGAGKTAVMQAFQRLFGVTGEQRRVRRQDFHIPIVETAPIRMRNFTIEAIVAFPELEREDADDAAVPDFFHQMAADDGGQLKCPLRLQATWTDDGSLDGAFKQKFWAIRTFGEFNEADCIGVNLKRIQTLMGHRDIKTTLNVYGHLIERVDAAERERTSVLTCLNRAPCGESVAH
jgi:hypothetical protein